MSLKEQFVGGLTSLADALPSNPYAASASVAAAAGLVIAAGWTMSNPVRMLTTDTIPSLSDGSPLYRDRLTGEPAVTAAQAVSAAPLDVPLDAMPRDGQGRAPYDVVGLATIRVAVDQFYSRLCADPELAEFFDHIDMAYLKRHQALFIGQLWGGPSLMPLEELAAKHQGLHISADRYWKVVGHLMVTLTHLKVPDWICVFTMTRLYQARDLIVEQTRPAPGDAAAAEA